MTMNNKTNLFQKIADPRSSRVPTNMPRPRAATQRASKSTRGKSSAIRDRQPLNLFFGFNFLDETEDESLSVGYDAEGNPRVRAKVGRTYHIQVTVMRTGMGGDPFLVLQDEDVELQLAVLSGQHRCVKLPANTCHLPYDDAAGFTHTFDLILEEDCPCLTLKLAVIPLLPRRRVLAECTFELDGIPLPPTDHREAVGLDPDFQYPSDVASVYIQEESIGVFRVTGFNTENPLPWEHLPYTATEFPEFIEMAEFITHQMPLDEIRGLLSNSVRHSDGLFKLRNWFKSLVRIHGERLNIIITDYTGSNFPWEMLELGPDEFLGAQARVVRWIPANTDSGRRKIRVHQEKRQGLGLSFIDPELGGAPQEKEAFAHVGATPILTMVELRQRLKEGVEGIAVVHLACHGTFTYLADNLTRVRKTALMTEGAKERVSVLQLEGIPEHSCERPLIIVNACESARLRKDGRGLFGLAEVLLTKCADAYIGTLGAVNTHYAGHIGRRLAQATHAGGGLHAADFLRHWRKKAVSEYVQHQNDPDPTPYAVKVVNAFLYIYFGNPLALWSLEQQTHTEPEKEAV